jgi:hypothetical protein
VLWYCELEKRYALDGDGILEENYDFDDAGRVTYHFVSYDWDSDSVADESFTERYVYDSGDLPSFYQSEFDYGADGVVDHRLSVTAEFSSEGMPVSTTEVSEFDNDGSGAFASMITTVSTYNEWASILQQTSQSVSPEGSFISRFTWNYDESGNAVSLTSEYDVDGDGTYDEVTEEFFNGSGGDGGTGGDDGTGNDGGSDGGDSGYYDTQEEYDSEGRLIASTTTYIDESGNASSVTVTHWSYRSDGQIDAVYSELDNDGNGSFDQFVMEQYQYDEADTLSDIIFRGDYDGDGIFEVEISLWSVSDGGWGDGNGEPGDYVTLNASSGGDSSSSNESESARDTTDDSDSQQSTTGFGSVRIFGVALTSTMTAQPSSSGIATNLVERSHSDVIVTLSPSVTTTSTLQPQPQQSPGKANRVHASAGATEKVDAIFADLDGCEIDLSIMDA